MKLAAAFAIAECVINPTKEMIIPSTLREDVAWQVAKAVREVAAAEMGLLEE